MKVKIIVSIVVALVAIVYFIPIKTTITTNVTEIKDKQTMNYKTLFKEKKLVTKMDEFQMESHIEQLNQNSIDLIERTDSYIKEKNLVLPTVKFSQKSKEKIQKLNKEFEKAQQKLEDLKNEN